MQAERLYAVIYTSCAARAQVRNVVELGILELCKNLRQPVCIEDIRIGNVVIDGTQSMFARVCMLEAPRGQ